jgi:hypothetical protein
MKATIRSDYGYRNLENLGLRILMTNHPAMLPPLRANTTLLDAEPISRASCSPWGNGIQ